MKSRMRKPSPALVVAVLALFFAIYDGAAARGPRPITGIVVESQISGGGTIDAGMVDRATVHCPGHDFVLSGGWDYQGSATITTDVSAPAGHNNAWAVEASNAPLGEPAKAHAIAYCAHFTH